MPKEGKKMIDLSQVKVMAVDGTEQVVDLSKELASAYYNKAQSLEEATACMDLFKTGKCEYSDTIRDGFIRVMNELKTGWPVRQGVIAALG